MNISNNSQRSKSIDILKGIAIFLVVLGHAIQYGNGIDYLSNQNFFDNLIFKIIYSFHMPLFMLISGYLFYYSISKKNIKELLKSRFTSIIIPIIAWGLLINILFYLVFMGDTL